MSTPLPFPQPAPGPLNVTNGSSVADVSPQVAWGSIPSVQDVATFLTDTNATATVLVGFLGFGAFTAWKKFQMGTLACTPTPFVEGTKSKVVSRARGMKDAKNLHVGLKTHRTVRFTLSSQYHLKGCCPCGTNRRVIKFKADGIKYSSRAAITVDYTITSVGRMRVIDDILVTPDMQSSEIEGASTVKLSMTPAVIEGNRSDGQDTKFKITFLWEEVGLLIGTQQTAFITIDAATGEITGDPAFNQATADSPPDYTGSEVMPARNALVPVPDEATLPVPDGYPELAQVKSHVSPEVWQALLDSVEKAEYDRLQPDVANIVNKEPGSSDYQDAMHELGVHLRIPKAKHPVIIKYPKLKKIKKNMSPEIWEIIVDGIEKAQQKVKKDEVDALQPLLQEFVDTTGTDQNVRALKKLERHLRGQGEDPILVQYPLYRNIKAGVTADIWRKIVEGTKKNEADALNERLKNIATLAPDSEAYGNAMSDLIYFLEKVK